MKYLLFAFLFFSLCVAFTPISVGRQAVMLRVTTVATEVQAPRLPTSTPAPPSSAYPAPAYPAPVKHGEKKKPAVVEPGLHCGHC